MKPQYSQKAIKRNAGASIPLARSTVIHRGANNSPRGSLVDGKFKISHREFVDTVSFTSASGSQGTFCLIGLSSLTPGYDVNPANDLLFPWLSQQAAQWEEFSFTRLRFTLMPKQAATSTGWVSLAFDYDYADTVSANKRDLLTNQTVVEGSSFVELSMPVDIASLNRVHSTRYIQSTAPTALDPRQIYAGYIEIAIDGYSASTSYSWDLWVDYDVSLSIPRSANELTEAFMSDVSVKCFGTNPASHATSIPLVAGMDIGQIGTVVTPTSESVTLTGPSFFSSGYTQPLAVVKTTMDQLRNDVVQFSGTVPDPGATATPNTVPSGWMLWDAVGSYLGVLNTGRMGLAGANGQVKYIMDSPSPTSAEELWMGPVRYMLPYVTVNTAATLGALFAGGIHMLRLYRRVARSRL
jgi:hypothetical protein